MEENLKLNKPTTISLSQRNNNIRTGPVIIPPITKSKLDSSLHTKSIDPQLESQQHIKSELMIVQEGDRKIINTRLLKTEAESAALQRKESDLRSKITALRSPAKDTTTAIKESETKMQ